MTGPTKGSVAGKAIQTGTQTKEWDEGFERTFGERKPARGRFVYTSGGTPLEEPVAVDGDWTQPDSGPARRSEEEVYGRITATDGADLSTRTRHREYMKANNLTIADDFKETWKRAEKERTTPGRNLPEIREEVGRAFYESEKKGRR